MITAHGSERLAVEAMKAGAYDYLTKPFELDELRLVVNRALSGKKLRREVQGCGEQLGVRGSLTDARGLIRDARLVRDGGASGRERLAGPADGRERHGEGFAGPAIHARSRRARQRFVALNCAALPRTWWRANCSVTKKAPSPSAQHAGRQIETADQGTLFLDEIGDMAPATQAEDSPRGRIGRRSRG